MELTTVLMRVAFDLSPNACLLINLYTGIVIQANKSAASMFKALGGALVGRTVDQFYPNQRGQLHAFSDEVLHRNYAYSRDLSIFDGNGERRNIEHMGVATTFQKETFLLLQVIDLDEVERRSINSDVNTYHRRGIGEWQRIESYFREMEQQYQLILSAAGEGIYGVNAQGITTFLNPAAEQMLGYRAEELVGSEMHSSIHHHHADGRVHPVEECPIYNVFKLGLVNKIVDDVFWCKDGSQIRVEYTSTPIINAGKVEGAVIVFRDITERQHNEERLKATLKENARLHKRLEMENAYLQEEILSHANHHEILGSSETIIQTLRQIDLVAPTEANAMITGESGTGKELVARAIHQASKRCDRPLIRVNCAAIPRELFESEFFGHIKGAFTGAIRDRVGRFELADGGTIFLDEVGEIPIDLQSKLLRVLQDQCFERVGEEKTRTVDVRVIAATNRNLKNEVTKGTFREDLFFRLNVFPIECHPLRDRLNDVPALAAHFLKICCSRMNIKSPTLTNANISELQSYDWPGNARELQNVIERAAILSLQGKMTFSLPQSTIKTDGLTARVAVPSNGEILTVGQIEMLEEENIYRALERCGGRVSGETGAAALLDMKPTTLYSRLKKMAPRAGLEPATQ